MLYVSVWEREKSEKLLLRSVHPNHGRRFSACAASCCDDDGDGDDGGDDDCVCKNREG